MPPRVLAALSRQTAWRPFIGRDLREQQTLLPSPWPCRWAPSTVQLRSVRYSDRDMARWARWARWVPWHLVCSVTLASRDLVGRARPGDHARRGDCHLCALLG